MKLFFWKKKANQPITISKKPLQEAEKTTEELSQRTEVTKAPEQLTAKETSQMNRVIEEVVDKRQYKMLVIKNWCEEKLTPVAYARVLVRILPVLREYGYDFRDMQHPTEKTRINRDFYLVVSATIREIYKEEYQAQEPALV